MYNFEEPSAIYKQSKMLYLLASIIGMQSSYIESTRELLKWNTDDEKAIGFSTFERIVKLRDGCEEFIFESVSKVRGGDKLGEKIMQGGITLKDMKLVLYYSNIENANEMAEYLFSNADTAPTFDNKLTLEEIMACTDCYALLCKDYYTHWFA